MNPTQAITATPSILEWGIFIAVIGTALVLDLGVFNRRSHAIGIREALKWTAMWFSLAVAFNIYVYFQSGSVVTALEFSAGYIVEQSLSVDNLFVFLVIFNYFAVPRELQHRVLYWGIIGAIVMRVGIIAGGKALLDEFHFLEYVFGAMLLITGIRMFKNGDEEIHPEANPLIKLFKRFVPVTDEYHGGKFFVRPETTVDGKSGRLFATPLFVVLLMVEFTDLVFAVDSIPAVFGVSKSTFIIVSSNIFAILGLRSLFFALSSMLELFHFLKHGLSVILLFIGTKMLVRPWYDIPIQWALGAVLGILVTSILLSLRFPKIRQEVEEVIEDVAFGDDDSK